MNMRNSGSNTPLFILAAHLADGSDATCPRAKPMKVPTKGKTLMYPRTVGESLEAKVWASVTDMAPLKADQTPLIRMPYMTVGKKMHTSDRPMTMKGFRLVSRPLKGFSSCSQVFLAATGRAARAGLLACFFFCVF